MKWAKVILLLLVGVITGLIVAKNEAFIIVMKRVNWSGLTFWFSLFLGALIPIIVNYFSIKQQEVIKLKSKLIQDKINIISEYKTFSIFMSATDTVEKSIEDLDFDYEPTMQDLSAPTIRGLNILSSHEIFESWRVQNILALHKLNSLGSERISNYALYMQNYILNLVILIENIPDYKLWNVSVAVKGDFFNMNNEISKIIDDYLNHTLYKFKEEYKKKENSLKQKTESKMNGTKKA